MSEETPNLTQLIRNEISEMGGMITFHRFMELALYHPEHGYYSSGRSRIGKDGDFFTSISVGRIFGRILGSICREVWHRLDRPREFTIVEQGANDGTLAADLLDGVMEFADPFSQALQYKIVEPFPANREKQSYKLQKRPEISWVVSLEDLPEFTGIHISNELLDAFPVHSLRWNGAKWMEECVRLNSSALEWTTRPIENQDLSTAAGLLPSNLPKGFRAEVNPGKRPWLQTLFQKIRSGVILTVDYGQAGRDRYAPHKADGTLLSYRNHMRFNDPLTDPGLRDITAEVDFTALSEYARSSAFDILGYSDQHHFLVGAAEPWLRSLMDSAPKIKTDLRALQTLMHPGSMGTQFKAIAFGKGFPLDSPLSCFKYQRPGIDSLRE